MVFTRQSNPPAQALRKPFKILKAHGVQKNLYCVQSNNSSPPVDQSTLKMLKSIKSMKTASLSSFLKKQSIAVGIRLFNAIKGLQ